MIIVGPDCTAESATRSPIPAANQPSGVRLLDVPADRSGWVARSSKAALRATAISASR